MTSKEIHEARKARGDSQEAAARAVGVSAKTWWTWERKGCNTPSVALLRALKEYVEGSNAATD